MCVCGGGCALAVGIRKVEDTRKQRKEKLHRDEEQRVLGITYTST